MLGDYAEAVRTHADPRNFPDELVDLYSIPAFDEAGSPERILASSIKSSKLLVPSGAVLVSKLNPHIPRIWFPLLDSGVRSLCSTEFAVLIPRRCSVGFLRYLVESAQVSGRLNELVSGTSGSHQRVSVDDLLGLDVVIPDEESQEHLSGSLSVVDARIDLSRRMIRSLDECLTTSFALEVDRHCTNEVPLGELFEPSIGGVWGEDCPKHDDDVAVSCLRGIDLANYAKGVSPDAPVRWISKQQFLKREFSDGEIWLEGSGSFCGRSMLITSELGKAFQFPVRYSNFVKRLKPIQDQSHSASAWLVLRDLFRTDEIANFRTGSAFPNLDVDSLLMNCMVPVLDGGPLRRIHEIASLRLSSTRLREIVGLQSIKKTLLNGFFDQSYALAVN